MIDDPAIQGIAPKRVVHTDDTGSYADAVRECSRTGEKIADYGTAHHGLGHAPPADHVRILAPAGVIEHYVPDMAVRVAAGTTLADLQEILMKEGQYLPLDGAAETQTVGELIAHNVAGPLRTSHGTMRDLLLGLRYVDGAGEVITVGGRTVKNVAGYDVTRLMVGGLNTLGLIAEATLRTAAIPEQSTRVTLRGTDPASLDSLMPPLLTSDAAPSYLVGGTRISGTTPPEHRLTFGYTGTPAGCDAQCTALLEWLAEVGLNDAPDRTDADLSGDHGFRAAIHGARAGLPAVVKVIVPPAATGQAVNTLAGLDVPPVCMEFLPVHGVIHLGADWTAEQAGAGDRSILALLGPLGGLRVWLRRPNDCPSIAPVAPEPTDRAMIDRLKRAMDPGDVLNPGRW